VPELPEVETIVRDLSPRLEGRVLHNPRLVKTDVLRGTTPRRFLAGVRNRRVVEVRRRAKHVVMLLDNGRRLVIQPRMTGSLLVYDGPLSDTERRYTVLRADLGADGTFVFRDVRRLGTIWLLDEPSWQSYTARIGPEPLHASFSVAQFAKQLRGSSQAIKKVLMDQRRLAGVGNIYANEALFRSRIDPSRPADRLTPNDVRRLHRAVRSILLNAIDAQGTTVRDYRTGTGQRGSYQQVLKVYGRGGEPCLRCGTLLATTHSIDGRSTTFCWRCQGGSS
jgi:formamidopyrimidine-DNA glycosylase